MKTKVLSVCMLLISLFGYSQDEKNVSNSVNNKMEVFNRKFFVAVTAGPSAPVGVFGSTSSTSKEAGFAKLGYNINIEGGYQIIKNLGVGASIFFSNYDVDQSTLTKFLNGSATPGVKGSTDHWRYYGIVVGPVGIIPVYHNVFVDIKTLIGIAHSNMPTAKIDISGNSSINSTSDNWSDAFTVKFGAGVRYNLVNNMCLIGNVNYNYMKPTWKISDASSLTQNISAVDFNVGIGGIF